MVEKVSIFLITTIILMGWSVLSIISWVAAFSGALATMDYNPYIMFLLNSAGYSVIGFIISFELFCYYETKFFGD